MPVLLQRSVAVRSAILALSCLTLFGLAHAALAEDDLGLRGLVLWPEQIFGSPASRAPAPVAMPIEAPSPRRHARRIWAASSRPLRITLDRERRHARLASRRRVAQRTAAVSSKPSRDGAARVIFLPRPDRPTLVTIYQDRTLRNGDAVMTADGIRLFRGGATWPHQRADFVQLQFAAKLGWSLRRTLGDMDRAPPSRWSMAEAAPAG